MSGMFDALIERERSAAPPPEPVEEALATRAARRYLFSESKIKRRGRGQEGGGQFSRVATPDRPLTQPFATMKPRGVRVTPQRHGVTKLSTVSKPRAPGARGDEPSHRKRKLSEEELIKSVGKGGWSESADAAAEALKQGMVEDTEAYHRSGQGTGYWSPDRIALHNRIYKLLLQGAGYHPEDAEATFLAGGPASGKSSLEKSGRLKTPLDAVLANPDLIKEMLPEAKALRDAGVKDWSSKVHEESSYIAKQLVNLALARKHHVVVDGVGNSERGKFRKRIKQAQAAGHSVRLIYATTDVPTAIGRSKARAAKSKREVPEGYLKAAHRDVTRRFVDDILPDKSIPVEIWDTTNGARLVARRVSGGGLVTQDRKLWAAWLRKAQTGQLAQDAA